MFDIISKVGIKIIYLNGRWCMNLEPASPDPGRDEDPGPGVVSWLDSLPAGEVGTTAVTAAELLYGVARMPDGRRKTELTAAVRGLLGEDFRGRVLPFDEHCASRYADIVRGRETRGRPIRVADAQIAAICRTAEAALATRNTDDFSGTGIELINPWKPDPPEPA